MAAMGVDGIGGGGGRPVRDVGAAAATTPKDAISEAKLGEAKAAHAVGGPRGSEALEQLRRGEIDLDRYLDTRVGEAVRPYEGKLPPAQLDFVRQSLREQLATDPVLVELVRRTTGAVPTPQAE